MLRTDDQKRNTKGVVACIVQEPGGTVRLVFDDVSSQTGQFPQSWDSSSHFTSVALDASAFSSCQLSDQQLADIGLSLVARLSANAKA